MSPGEIEYDNIEEEGPASGGPGDHVDTKRTETLVLKALIIFLTLALIASVIAYFMLPFDIPLIIK